MKKKTKIFSAVMAFSLALFSGVFIKEVSAANVIDCEFSGAEDEQGKVVSFIFSSLVNPGTTGYQLELEYNKDVLEIQTKQVEAEDDEGNLYMETVADITDYGMYKGFTDANPEANPIVISAFDDMAKVNNRESGKIFSINFKIKEDAKPDTYTIKLTGNFLDKDLNDVEMNLSKETVVTVKCAHKSTHIERKEPTCIEKGSTNTICDNCGNVINTKEISALGHEFKQYTVSEEPTCEGKGKETAKCTRCEDIDTREVPALGHKQGEWENTLEPTCTEKGSKVRKCTVCNKVIETEEVSALGHDFKEYTISKEATCEEKGEESAKCTRCDSVDIRETQALGHKFISYKITKEAAETESGEMIRVCGVCEKEVITVIPALKDIGNKVSGANGVEFQKTYEAGSVLVFLAEGIGIVNDNPQTGDIRYLPVSWKLTGMDKEHEWENAPYTAEIELKEAGEYALTITFAREIYEAEKGWTADGLMVTEKKEFQVTEKKQNGEESGSQEGIDRPEQGSNTNNVDTGEAASVIIFVATAAMAIAGTMIITLRKKNFK